MAMMVTPIEARFIQSSCLRKRRFRSKGAVEAAVRAYRERFGTKAKSYPCAICKGWHFTSGGKND